MARDNLDKKPTPRPPPPAAQNAAAAIAPALPHEVSRRGISEAAWRTLKNSLYPGAANDSILMVIDYCKARKLDPMKKPCHIVPMNVKDAKTGEYGWRDVVMPGVYELRTTAMRTGLYLGHSTPEYGVEIEFKGLKVPEWCQQTFYRWHAESKTRIEFTVRTLFAECCGLTNQGQPNKRWNAAPVQMMTKCNEAAGLREAFPDEVGGEHAAEESDYSPAIESPAQGKPETKEPQAIAQDKPPAAGSVEALAPTVGQLRATVRARLDKSGVPENHALAHFELGSIDEMDIKTAQQMIDWLDGVSP
jgi:phage recombination protein Bet